MVTVIGRDRYSHYAQSDFIALPATIEFERP